MKRTTTILSLLITLFMFSLSAEASFPVVKSKKSGEVSLIGPVNSIDLSSSIVSTMDDMPMYRAGKSQQTAAILAGLVGWLGIHRFYLGYPGIGLLQIITLGGFGIWSFVDFIRIITGDLRPRKGRYSKTF